MINRNKELRTARLVLKPIGEESRNEMLGIFRSDEVKKTYMIPDFSSEEESEWLFFAGYGQFSSTVFRSTSDVGNTEAVILFIGFACDYLAVFDIRLLGTGIGNRDHEEVLRVLKLEIDHFVFGSQVLETRSSGSFDRVIKKVSEHLAHVYGRDLNT